jgi:hypothetical protein
VAEKGSFSIPGLAIFLFSEKRSVPDLIQNLQLEKEEIRLE